MATSERGNGGITVGGVIVIVGIVVMIVWSFLIGLIITLIGLIAFGGFARGKWY
jgi:hypothetical protein